MMNISIQLILVYLSGLCICESPYHHGMACNNNCAGADEDDPDKFWCGQRRAGEGEQVWRCADATRYGYLCASTCDHHGESYTWCRTGFHLKKDWEYCSLPGESIYGKKCASECKRRGTSYWWCDTQDDSWDYCSPPQQVTPVSYTVHGQECLGGCAQNGEEYWWCGKSMRWEGSGRARTGADDSWDYCSPDSHHTRYNQTCFNNCDHYGESYNWCYTNQKRDWDYCSPRVDVNYTYSNEGYLCVGRCVGWCPVLGGSGSNAYYRCDGISSGSTIRGSMLLLVLFIMFVC